MCYHAQFGHFSTKSVLIDIGKPQKLGSAGALPFGTRLRLTPKTISLPICVTTSNLLISIRELPKLGSAKARPLAIGCS